MKIGLPLFLLGLLAVACTPAIKPVEYGADACHFCKMTIVDPQHAAEAVSSKGKVFLFDAIECMVNFLKEEPTTDWAILVVNDYQQPGTWTDARTASYLICPNIASPMGKFLTGFAELAAAQTVQQQQGGERYNWETLQQAW